MGLTKYPGYVMQVEEKQEATKHALPYDYMIILYVARVERCARRRDRLSKSPLEK